MPFASHSETVVASVQRIWDLLLDKIDNPGKYVLGVQHCEILVRGTGFVIRRMKTADGLELIERITADEASRTVEFALVDHPIYRGKVENVITTNPEGGYPTLTFTLDWRPREGAGDGMDMQPLVVRAVKNTKKLAEAVQNA